MTAVRLGDEPEHAPARLVTFTFDGRRLSGREGEPLAAALLAAGERILSRSFRFHRPRGLMCSTGQCGWCECEVDGRPSQRTCRIALAEGTTVRGEHAVPSVRRDALGLLDLGSRLVPPTFYHHRFLRPRRFRKLYLDVIRWFGGRGSLGSVARDAPAAGVLRDEACDVLVVGGGPSGVVAAQAAAAAGAHVIVLEADPSWVRDAGAAGAGNEATTPPRRTGHVDIRGGATAVGWYGGVVAAVSASECVVIRPGAVVAATGSYERLPAVPGIDRPGVMSARLVLRLVERDRVLPGARSVLIGSGAELERAAAAVRAAGGAAAGPYDTSALVRVLGRRCVSGVEIRGPEGIRRERADIVVLADRVPALDLVLSAGAATVWRGERLTALLDEDGRTRVGAVFAVGGAADRSGDVDMARRTGEAAARAALAARADWQDRPRRADDSLARFSPARSSSAPGDGNGTPTHLDHSAPRRSRAAGEALVCFCEDVRVREIVAERDSGYVDVELLKRRTGALTGPCQGKYCLVGVACATGESRERSDWLPPFARPPLRPIRLGDLVGPHPLATPDDPSPT